MEEIEFSVDNLKLKGNLFYPLNPKAKNPVILFIHGWTSEKKRSFQYAQALIKLGFIVMLFDMRGHGESEGDIALYSPKEFLKDCLAAYDCLALTKGVNENQISVVGSSFGGYLGSILTSKRKVKNLVLRVPADYQNEKFEKPKMGNAGENPEVFKWRTLPKKYNETFTLEAIHQFDGNVLIIESGKDDVVPHQTIQNYIGALKNKDKLNYIILKDAPHSLQEVKLKDQVEKILVDWFSKLS